MKFADNIKLRDAARIAKDRGNNTKGLGEFGSREGYNLESNAKCSALANSKLIEK